MDLLLGADRTVVVTGATRSGSMLGSDGARNLVDAIRTAAEPAVEGLGALVVLDGTIHAARHVNKDHAHSLSAFSSWPGPIGWVAEDRVYIASRPPAMWRSSLDHMEQVPPVALISTSLGDDGRLLSALPDLGYAGVVVEGLGGGHVPSRMAPMLEALAATTPVVITKGTRCGSALSSTYAYPGSEVDLLGRGLISSGWLTAAQARVLLGLLLAQGADPYGIRDVFSQAPRW
jgi:L-asparaginase